MTTTITSVPIIQTLYKSVQRCEINSGNKTFPNSIHNSQYAKQNRFDLYNNFDAISIKAFFATPQNSINDIKQEPIG